MGYATPVVSGVWIKKKKDCEIRTGVSGAWAGSPCNRPAFLRLA